MAYKTSINADFPTFNPGLMRHQITLLTQTIGNDAAGANVTWQTSGTTAWAAIDYLRGSEVIKSGEDITNVYLKVTLWFRPEFTAQSRIQLANGQQFIIQYVENVKQMSQFAILTCLGIGAADQ